jgi:hypothetical protein
MSFSSAGHEISATAFFSQRNDGSGRLLHSSHTGDFATLTSWSDGLGLENPVNANESGVKNSAIDNSGRKDFVLLRFDNAYSLQSFELGWQQAGPKTKDTSRFVDLQFWIGGTDDTDFDFTTKCIMGCAKAKNNLENMGWIGFGLEDVGYGDILFDPSVGATRTLLISGNLAERDDFFQLLSITLNTETLNSVPEPSSIVLAGLALFASAWQLKRKARS